MTTFRDRFKDTRWLAKQEALIQQAGYKCQDCETSLDLQVHICYYLDDRELWGYPDNAYKVYCVEHREERHRIEQEIRQFIAGLSISGLGSLREALVKIAAIEGEIQRDQAAERLYISAKREYHNNAAEWDRLRNDETV